MLATAGLIAVGMAATIWWGPQLIGRTAWTLPHDLWGTLAAARRLLHLNLGGLYTQPTGLVTFPGAALILVPVVAVIEAAGLSLQVPGPQHLPQPGVAVDDVLDARDVVDGGGADHLGCGTSSRAGHYQSYHIRPAGPAVCAGFGPVTGGRYLDGCRSMARRRGSTPFPLRQLPR